MRRSIPILILVAALVTGAVSLLASPAAQDDANGPATIITFLSDMPFIDVAAAEAGTTTATLSWFVVGLDENQRLVLERYDIGQFVSMLGEGETTLPLTGEREITIQSPSSFAPPTYRLSILDFRNRIIDQRTVVIPYVTPVDAEVTIEQFSADAESLDPAALQSGEARVNVTWAVVNRPPTANLRFEQLVDDEPVLVELPRNFLWIPSNGTGAIAPVSPDEGDPVELRLRVIDSVDGTVYAEQVLAIPVGGAETQEVTPLPEAERTAEPGAVEIVSFTATPETVVLGEAVQLQWQVIGATNVQIAVRTPTSTALQVIADNLPVRAGLIVPVGADTFGDVDSLTFVLRALDANGELAGISRADVVVDAG